MDDVEITVAFKLHGGQELMFLGQALRYGARLQEYDDLLKTFADRKKDLIEVNDKLDQTRYAFQAAESQLNEKKREVEELEARQR